MSLSVEFSVPRVPITINKLSRSHWSKRVAEKKTWMQEFQAALHFGKPLAIQILRSWAECEDRVRIEILVIHTREFDQDNLWSVAKIPLDALKGLRCIVDDDSKHIELKVTQMLGKQKLTQFLITRMEG